MQVKVCTADTPVITGQGTLHTVSIAPATASVTAGLLTVYDNTAESGTVLYEEWVLTSVVGHTITLDCDFHAGLYVGFDATLANAAVTVTFQ
jgi:hypothetical protein